MNSRTVIFSAIMIAFVGSLSADIFSGPSMTFTKDAFADPTLEANQDRITDNVWITRGNTQGIFNAATEGSYTNFTSPADTEWAFIGLNGNPTGGDFIGATNFANLVFANWQDAVDENPPGSVGLAAVVHLISDDHYIDITFDAWGIGGGAGGSFTYTRSTQAIPEPTSLIGILTVSSMLCLRRKR